MKLENYVKLYYNQWQKIEKRNIKFPIVCMDVKEKKLIIQITCVVSAMSFLIFYFFVKLCDPCLLTSYSVLYTTSRGKNNSC